ncbi:MAG TPA: MoaD/ThiS family protein [Pseudonocardiaceae bacterium]|jgi:molybdopterin converting factor small subunit|nr:MoaD/ThiS family protein [Pseudonocardiaceae bacterium]
MRVRTTVRVRYFAGARAAAGVPEEQIELPATPSVEDVLTLLRERRGHGFAKVLTGCSFLLDGVAVRDRAAIISERADLDVLPPFAGG